MDLVSPWVVYCSEDQPDQTTVFNAELRVILNAPRLVSFFPDSTSASLTSRVHSRALSPFTSATPRSGLTPLPWKSLSVSCWVPACVGISGNERANRLSSNGCNLRPRPQPTPCSDYFLGLHSLVKNLWQRELDQETLKLRLELWAFSFHPSRIKETVLTRLRNGHTRLTHVSWAPELQCCDICYK